MHSFASFKKTILLPRSFLSRSLKSISSPASLAELIPARNSSRYLLNRSCTLSPPTRIPCLKKMGPSSLRTRLKSLITTSPYCLVISLALFFWDILLHISAYKPPFLKQSPIIPGIAEERASTAPPVTNVESTSSTALPLRKNVWILLSRYSSCKASCPQRRSLMLHPTKTR